MGNTSNVHHRPGGRSGKIRPLFQSGAAAPEENSLSLKTSRCACPVSGLQCVKQNPQKLHIPGDESRASLQQGLSVPRRHSLGVQQPSDPSDKSVWYVVQRTFSISMSMASSSSSLRAYPAVRPPRTPRPAAPPSIATASPGLIALEARSILAPGAPLARPSRGAQIAVCDARHKVLPRSSFEFHAGSPPCRLSQPDPYPRHRFYNRLLEGCLSRAAPSQRLQGQERRG
jgi:hypothetical protein